MLMLNKTGDFFVCCNQSHGPGGNQEVVLCWECLVCLVLCLEPRV